jgi:hypothetical protein
VSFSSGSGSPDLAEPLGMHLTYRTHHDAEDLKAAVAWGVLDLAVRYKISYYLLLCERTFTADGVDRIP